MLNYWRKGFKNFERLIIQQAKVCNKTIFKFLFITSPGDSITKNRSEE